jgi:SAM-dependent methyltransferase
MTRLPLLLVLLLAACPHHAAPASRPASQPASASAPAEDPLARLRGDAKLLEPMVKSDLGRAYLAATADLIAPAPRPLAEDPKAERIYGAAGAARLDEATRATLQPLSERDAVEFYYNTYHGTPLAYARAIDLLGQQGVKPGKLRLADFGFGNIGQLRLLASLGFDTTGIDVSPFLADLYTEPSDQGPYGKGSVKLVFGRYPLETGAVVGDLDVFLSKNTLKRGYIHPYRTPAKPEWVINLGVTDEVFLKTIHDALKPGGFFLIYNICPALTPEDQPFVPWSDGRSPFTREQFAAAGFKVIAFEIDDTKFVREMGHLLGWDKDEDPLNLENDLSVIYTLVQRE